MGIGIFLQTGQIHKAPPDPHTLLLLHGESIEDSSMYHVPLTNNGVVVSTAQSKFGGKSLYFDGNLNRISAPENMIKIHTGDFTIDWWEFAENMSGNQGCRFRTNGDDNPNWGGFMLGYLNGFVCAGKGPASWDIINGKKVLDATVHTWTHFAVIHEGNVLKTYKNGILQNTNPFIGEIWSEPNMIVSIGAWTVKSGNGYGFKGYMDEFRISDVARWTSDFTPPTKPY